MTDPRYCRHEDHVPVEARSRGDRRRRDRRPPCCDCLEQLHAGWGCLNCHWDEDSTRTFADPHDRPIFCLARPCKEHA